MPTSSPETQVRDMTLRDLAAVERIYRAHASPTTTRSRRQIRARVAEALRGLPGTRAVALVGTGARGRALGYLVGDVREWEFGSEPAGWIFALGVDPAAERHGLGRRLLEAAVERFAAMGVRTVRTMVRKDDVPVLRFFRSGHFAAGPYVELELSLGR